MAKPKRPGTPVTAPAAPATAKVPAPAGGTQPKPTGPTGAPARRPAPAGGAARNAPPPPPPAKETAPPPSDAASVVTRRDIFDSSKAVADQPARQAEGPAAASGVPSDMLRALVESRRAVQSGLKLATDAQDRIYAERLAQVEDLRKRGEIGPRSLKVSMPGETRGAPTYVYPSAQAYKTTVGRRDVLAGLSAPPQSPTAQELDTPIWGVRAAQEIGKQYMEAQKAYEASQLAADTVARDLYASGAQRSAAAADTQRALERVAQLRAALREYGWTDEKEFREAHGLKLE